MVGRRSSSRGPMRATSGTNAMPPHTTMNEANNENLRLAVNSQQKTTTAMPASFRMTTQAAFMRLAYHEYHARVCEAGPTLKAWPPLGQPPHGRHAGGGRRSR